MSKTTKRSKNPGRSQQILKDHKRVGKKFVPPMIHLLGGLQEISYVHQILPETIWVGLINDELGYRAGIELCTQLAKTAKEIHQSEKFVNFALCSSYSLLTDEEKPKIIERIEHSRTFGQLRACLAPLVILYEGFPMAFLGKNNDSVNKHALIDRLKQSVARHMNKYETPGMAIQTAVIYIRGITGGLCYANDVEVPDLNAIITNPESEAGKKAAGSVRAYVLSEMMPAGKPLESGWAASFWNQGHKIDTCELNETKDG